MWNPSLKSDIKPECENCKGASQAGKPNFPLHNEDKAWLPHTLRWLYGSQSVPLPVAGLKFLHVMTGRHITV